MQIVLIDNAETPIKSEVSSPKREVEYYDDGGGGGDACVDDDGGGGLEDFNDNSDTSHMLDELVASSTMQTQALNDGQVSYAISSW